MDPTLFVILFYLFWSLVLLRVRLRMSHRMQISQAFGRVIKVWNTVERRTLIPMNVQDFGVRLPQLGYANWAFKTGSEPTDPQVGYWKHGAFERIVLTTANEPGGPVYEFTNGRIVGDDHRAVYAAECLLGRIQGVIASAER